MVDFTNMNVGQLAGDAASGLANGVMMTIWVLLGLAVIGFIWYMMQFKYTVHLKVMTQQGFYVVKDKAKEVKVDGVKFWQLLRRRVIVTPPPPEAVHMTAGGKFMAEGYWSDDSELVWATDTVTRDNFNQLVTEEVTGKDENGKDITVKVVRDAFQPFTAQQRALQAHRIRQAQERRRKNIWETLGQLATPLVLAMLFICVLVFWEDIAKPVQDLAASNVAVSEQNAKISEQNARLLSALIAHQEGRPVVIEQQLGGPPGG